MVYGIWHAGGCGYAAAALEREREYGVRSTEEPLLSLLCAIMYGLASTDCGGLATFPFGVSSSD
jgi:hypothetical protein